MRSLKKLKKISFTSILIIFCCLYIFINLYCYTDILRYLEKDVSQFNFFFKLNLYFSLMYLVLISLIELIKKKLFDNSLKKYIDKYKEDLIFYLEKELDISLNAPSEINKFFMSGIKFFIVLLISFNSIYFVIHIEQNKFVKNEITNIISILNNIENKSEDVNKVISKLEKINEKSNSNFFELIKKIYNSLTTIIVFSYILVVFSNIILVLSFHALIVSLSNAYEKKVLLREIINLKENK